MQNFDRFRFRVWNKEGRLYDAESAVIDLENDIIMQCTGLKDKNDKLIYEGDILKDSQNNFNIVKYYFNGINGFMLDSFDNKNKDIVSTYQILDSQKYYEVIGNIYENPGFNMIIGNEKTGNEEGMEKIITDLEDSYWLKQGVKKPIIKTHHDFIELKDNVYSDFIIQYITDAFGYNRFDEIKHILCTHHGDIAEFYYNMNNLMLLDLYTPINVQDLIITLSSLRTLEDIKSIITIMLKTSYFDSNNLTFANGGYNNALIDQYNIHASRNTFIWQKFVSLMNDKAKLLINNI